MPTGGKAIGLNYARQLVDNFKKNRLDKLLPKNDSQAVWFSKEVILDALGLPPGTNTGTVTGIRIYLAAYEIHDGFPSNIADQNKLTMVLVPTGTDEVEFDHGIETETAFKDIIDAQTMAASYPDEDPTIPAGRYYNDGQLYPPPRSSEGLGL
jgi:hypothetical protein